MFYLLKRKRFHFGGPSAGASGPVSPADLPLFVRQLQYTSVTTMTAPTIALDPAQFDLGPVVGNIVDFSDPNNPVVTPVNYAGTTDEPILNISTTSVTRLAINTSGVLVKNIQDRPFTEAERRTLLPIAVILHPVDEMTDAQPEAVPSYNFPHGAMDHINSDGIKLTGGGLIFPTADLKFAQDAMSYTLPFINLTNGSNTPSTVGYPAESPKQFRYNRWTGVDEFTATALLTDIDPTIFDDGTATPPDVPNQKWSFQRVYMARRTSLVFIIPAQSTYNNKEEAIIGSSRAGDPPVISDLISNGGIHLGDIIIKKECASLQDDNTFTWLPSQDVDSGGGSQVVVREQYFGYVAGGAGAAPVVSDRALGFVAPYTGSIKQVNMSVIKPSPTVTPNAIQWDLFGGSTVEHAADTLTSLVGAGTKPTITDQSDNILSDLSTWDGINIVAGNYYEIRTSAQAIVDVDLASILFVVEVA